VVGRNAAMVVDEDLHDLSLQGPAAVDFLAKQVPGIRDLKYFHHLADHAVRASGADLAHRLQRRARL
jgi:glycine cleavage system aminomethyltransferase T